MAIVELEYVAAVIVEVDTETGEVVRVNVDDEGSHLSEHDRESTDPNTVAARNIAEGDAMWPAWEFGF